MTEDFMPRLWTQLEALTVSVRVMRALAALGMFDDVELLLNGQMKLSIQELKRLINQLK